MAIQRRMVHPAALVPLLVPRFVVKPRMGSQDNLRWEAVLLLRLLLLLPRLKKRLLECLCWRPDRFFDRLISTLAAWPGIVFLSFQKLAKLGIVQENLFLALGLALVELEFGRPEVHLPIG